MDKNSERRASFLTSWLAHGNVRRAMREAGVGSPTTAYRWIDAYRQDGETWRNGQPAGSARRVPAGIAAEIVALREYHPTWGKSRIAHTLEARHGAPVVSPTGVRSILREAGLWMPTAISPAADDARVESLDPDQLLHALQRGIHLDLFNRPLDAIHYLEDLVCRPLLRQPHLIALLLQEPELGSWLLRGGLQLAHALLDTGRWASALRYLRLIEFWLSRDESQLSAALADYQNAGDRWVTENDPQWRTVATGVELPPAAARLSLRQDDIWLEAQRYLGIILRDGTGEEAEEILTGALRVMDGRASRQFSPQLATRYRGIFQYNLAALKLRRSYPDWSILRDLEEAEELLAHDGDHGMLGSAVMLHAKVLARQGKGSADHARMDACEEAVWAALAQAERATTLVTRARLAIEGTELLLGFRDGTDEDRARLENAAELCVSNGFAVQARKLLDYRRIRELMPEMEQSLGDMTSKAHPLGQRHKTPGSWSDAP